MSLPKFGQLYRLTRDPEVSYSANGVCICRVSLACSEKYNDKETQLFIDATAFKKTAEMLGQVQKGQRVFIIGKLQTDVWQDQQSGKNRYKTCLIVESFEFIEPKSNNSQQNYQGQQQNSGYQSNNGQGNYQQPSQPQGQPGFQGQNYNQGRNDSFGGKEQGFNPPPDDD